MSRYVQRLGLVALVIFGIPGSTSGEPVSIQDAKRVAVNQLLSTGWVVRDAAPAIEVIPETEGERDIYYTINFQPEGWAIVSADDVAYPVIAYSASGRQVDEGVSPSFAAWMENVKA